MKSVAVRCVEGCHKMAPLRSIVVLESLVNAKTGVVRTYFCCPSCGKEYTAFYEDEKCREWRKLLQNASKEESAKLQESIGERMKLLRRIYGKE